MIIHKCDQYGEMWWRVRRGVPTVSEFKKLLTSTGKLSAQAGGYCCKLIGDLYDRQYPRTDGVMTSAMKNGKLMEPEARSFYELKTGVMVQQVGFITTDDGRFGCSPDALVGDDGILELKSPNPQTHFEWLVDGVLPAEHSAQVHGSLVVTDRKWADFMSYVDGAPEFLVRVTPDEYTEQLREAMEVFWLKYQGLLSLVREKYPMAETQTEHNAQAEEDAALALFGGSGSSDANMMNES